MSLDKQKEMASMQIEKANLERSLHDRLLATQSNSYIVRIYTFHFCRVIMWTCIKETFETEKEHLLNEINGLKKQKQDLEEAVLSKSVEVAKLKENLNRHHLDKNRSSQDFSKLEAQVILNSNFIMEY